MRVVADVEVAADAAHVGVAEGRCGLVHRHAQLVGGESGVHEFLEKLVLDGVEAGVQPLGGGGNGGGGSIVRGDVRRLTRHAHELLAQAPSMQNDIEHTRLHGGS